MRVVLVLFLLLNSGAYVWAQPGEDGNESPGDGGNAVALPVQITANPTLQLPVGVSVDLMALHDPVASPSYFWEARCIHVPFRYTDSTWLGQTINSGCIGAAGTKRFYCEVSHQSAEVENPGKGELDITWNPPNRYRTTLSTPYTVNGSPIHAAVNATTVLKWGEVPIGQCANVCAGEAWHFRSAHPITRRWHKATMDAWWPNCTTPSPSLSINGASANPNPTWLWQSPTLIDVYGFFLPQGMLDPIPVGTVLGHKRHKYRFVGDYCDGTQWTLYTTPTYFQLVVREVDGVKRPVFENL